jgi:hypothetical protein
MNQTEIANRCSALVTRLGFWLVTSLLRSRWASGYREYISPWEEGCSARIGPLHLGHNDCQVLDHQDASISLHLPIWYRRHGRGQRGQLRLGWRVCMGSEPIRSAGLKVQWYKPNT